MIIVFCCLKKGLSLKNISNETSLRIFFFFSKLITEPWIRMSMYLDPQHWLWFIQIVSRKFCHEKSGLSTICKTFYSTSQWPLGAQIHLQRFECLYMQIYRILQQCTVCFLSNSCVKAYRLPRDLDPITFFCRYLATLKKDYF